MQRKLVVDLATGEFQVLPISDPRIIGPVDYGWVRFNEALSAWIERFRADKWAAARACWDELRAGIAEAFAAGPAAIPDQRAPGPAAKVDVMAKK